MFKVAQALVVIGMSEGMLVRGKFVLEYIPLTNIPFDIPMTTNLYSVLVAPSNLYPHYSYDQQCFANVHTINIEVMTPRLGMSRFCQQNF